ncbi:TPA: major tail protein [Enterococcus faecium]|uniref:major tail protein n=1 Tax=Enterococcus faecium TaxID=1352 RepID=UPI0003300C3B|nr:major tail protein [Enterococcus faecium]EGP5288168.1 phage tail protein [Enterococcus faecium]EIR3865059.1 phage tail protein [Enterococcus faecium]EME3178453.1 phage tail protein [Enterococcus faecium]EME3577036.1 phage tail protein [Enterococcus faecium]EME8199825.1 phage tail protein [Enterococcus faecium]
MATVGFESVIFGVKTGVGGTLKELVADKSKGGAIEAKITGLGATSNTTYASNVPFFIASKGVSSPKVTLDVADLMDNGIYSEIIGAKTVEGANVIGSETEAPYVSVVMVTANKEGKRLFMGLTKGKFSHPDIDMKTAEDKGVELQTDSIEGEFISDERGYVYLTAVESETMTLDAFKNLVNNKAVE